MAVEVGACAFLERSERAPTPTSLRLFRDYLSARWANECTRDRQLFEENPATRLRRQLFKSGAPFDKMETCKSRCRQFVLRRPLPRQQLRQILQQLLRCLAL